MRAFILGVAGIAFGFVGCSSYGTDVEIQTTPPVIHVASISVTLPRSLQTGTSARAVATIKGDNGAVLTDRSVEWFSSSASVASVDTQGTVEGVAAGNAVVSAVADGVSGTAAVAVIDPPPTPTPVATVSVALNPTAVIVGQTSKATATLKDASGNTLTGRTLTWQSSNTNIASVSSTGDVTAKAAGTASITASSEGQSGLASLTVDVPPPVPVASVSVSPSTSTLQVGGTVQLSAVTRDANNNVLTGRSVAWSSANSAIASVSTSGLVTAVAAGSVQITASSEGKSGSSSITVNAVTVPVATVTVSLVANTLDVGSTTQASAITKDANGNTLTGRQISWSSNNSSIATVSQSGIVTAVAAGTAQITATSETKTGSATLTVNAPAPPPPPPPGGSVEPTGMTPLTERPFSAVTEDGWTVAPWSGTVANCEVVSDANAPKSPTSVGRIKYPVGFASGGEPCGMSVSQLPSVRTMYLSFWFKVSSNWIGHPTGANKILHVNIGGSNHFVVNLWGYDTGILQMGILLQGIVNNGSGGTAANWLPNLGPTGEIVRGQWYHVEVIAVGNTSGAANGSVDWWLDGVKVGSHSGIQYVSGSGTWGERIAWAPTWGGAGPSVTSEMYQFIDHIYVSGK